MQRYRGHMESQYFDACLREIARTGTGDLRTNLRNPALFEHAVKRYRELHPHSFHWINEASLRARAEEVLDQLTRKDALDAIPVVEQRSEEWYRMRDGMLTASDWGQALGVGKFGTVRNVYEKKCPYGDEKPFDDTCPPLVHGQLFEPVATEIYQMRYGFAVDEYGIVGHPQHSFLGASPDGVNDLGVMLEIKCPYRREISGAILDQYFHQIQGQLEVCDLEYCDFVECSFEKAFSLGELREVESDYKGIILVKHDGTKVYGRVNDLDTLAEAAPHAKTAYYYFLVDYHIKRVKRDRAWFRRRLPELQAVWDNVLRYRSSEEDYVREVRNPPTARRKPAASSSSKPKAAKPYARSSDNTYDHTVPMFRETPDEPPSPPQPQTTNHSVPMFRNDAS